MAKNIAPQLKRTKPGSCESGKKLRKIQNDEDTSIIKLNVRRFSDVKEESMSFPKTLKIEDLLENIRVHWNLRGKNFERHIYQKYRELEKSDKLENQIEMSDGPAKISVCCRPVNRRLPRKMVTDKPDMINPWEEDDRFLMSCGHAATPDNIYTYCWSELRARKPEIRCPAIIDSDTGRCKAVWEFIDIIHGACLSPDEINLFSQYLNDNWLNQAKNIQLCPWCNEAIEKSSCNVNKMECVYCKRSFCFLCLGIWYTDNNKICGNNSCQSNVNRMENVLGKCSRKTIIGIEGCPCIRACPKCKYVLEHTSSSDDSCKHMTCTQCKTKFCFICLKVKTDEWYWPCGGAYEQCRVAPTQTM